MGHTCHQSRNEQRTLWAAVLTGAFMLAEVVGGLLSGSLALLADAGHMLTDTVALGMAWLAFRLGRRPEDAERTYGFDRLQVLVAFGNGLALFFVAGWIVVEAVHRLFAPVAVEGPLMLAVASAGLVLNCAVLVILHGGDKHNMNMQGARLHVIGDLLGSVAAVVAALAIMQTGWMPVDPILSALVAVVILRSAGWLVWSSGRVLLEAAPRHLQTASIGADLVANVPGVVDVHHLHVWQLTAEKPVVTLHVRLAEQASGDAVIAAVQERLREKFGLDHATVQVEREACPNPA